MIIEWNWSEELIRWTVRSYFKYSIGSPLWKIRPEAGNFWDFAPKTEQKMVFWKGKNASRHPQNPQKSPAALMNMSDTILQASVD